MTEDLLYTIRYQSKAILGLLENMDLKAPDSAHTILVPLSDTKFRIFAIHTDATQIAWVDTDFSEMETLEWQIIKI